MPFINASCFAVAVVVVIIILHRHRYEAVPCSNPVTLSGRTLADATTSVSTNLNVFEEKLDFLTRETLKNRTFSAVICRVSAPVLARVSACFLDFFRPIFEGRTFSAAAPDRTFGPFTAEFCRFEALPTLFKPSGLIEADRTFSARFADFFGPIFEVSGPQLPNRFVDLLAPLCQHRSC